MSEAKAGGSFGGVGRPSTGVGQCAEQGYKAATRKEEIFEPFLAQKISNPKAMEEQSRCVQSVGRG